MLAVLATWWAGRTGGQLAATLAPYVVAAATAAGAVWYVGHLRDAHAIELAAERATVVSLRTQIAAHVAADKMRTTAAAVETAAAGAAIEVDTANAITLSEPDASPAPTIFDADFLRRLRALK